MTRPEGLNEASQASYRWPLVIAAIVIVCLSILTSFSLRRDGQFAKQAIDIQMQHRLGHLAASIRALLASAENAISGKRFEPYSFVERVGYRVGTTYSIEFSPNCGEEKGAASNAVMSAPTWYIEGRNPPRGVLSRHDFCFGLLRRTQSASTPNDKNRIREILFNTCPSPMIVDDHCLQAEELVRYGEHRHCSDTRWTMWWRRLLKNHELTPSQKQFLRTRLKILLPHLEAAQQKEVERVIAMLKPRVSTAHQWLDKTIAKYMRQFSPDLARPMVVVKPYLFLIGRDRQNFLWGAAVNVKKLMRESALTEFEDIIPLVSWTLREATASGSLSHRLWPDQHIWLVAKTPQKQLNALAQRHRILVGTMLSVALLMIILLVYFDYRRIKNLSRTDRLRAEFIGRISHQFRTPLTSIQLYAQTLINRELAPERARHYLQTIATEAARLGQTTHRLLNSVRLEQNKYRFHRASFDIESVVNECCDRGESQICARDSIVKLTRAFQSPISRYVGDRDSISDACDNLIENAVKYTDENGYVVVRLTETSTHIVIAVSDNGPGIPRAYRKHVFRRYYRINDALNQRVIGSGLGLSIVKHIVDAHDGTCKISDNPPRGVTVTMMLPKRSQNDDREYGDAE
ncbi:MAG: HAMP domain-containing sensor histidine kinase [Myxococcota bacterium]|nr:HAMP domain-containing sensor histidine kinase [Myxococcota bacterium]